MIYSMRDNIVLLFGLERKAPELDGFILSWDKGWGGHEWINNKSSTITLSQRHKGPESKSKADKKKTKPVPLVQYT